MTIELSKDSDAKQQQRIGKYETKNYKYYVSLLECRHQKVSDLIHNY